MNSIFKGKYYTFKVMYVYININASYILFLTQRCISYDLHLRRVQKCHFDTGIIIRPSVKQVFFLPTQMIHQDNFRRLGHNSHWSFEICLLSQFVSTFLSITRRHYSISLAVHLSRVTREVGNKTQSSFTGEKVSRKRQKYIIDKCVIAS